MKIQNTNEYGIKIKYHGNRLLFYNIAQYLYVYTYLFKRQLLSFSENELYETGVKDKYI
jgi:hypothetical protein